MERSLPEGMLPTGCAGISEEAGSDGKGPGSVDGRKPQAPEQAQERKDGFVGVLKEVDPIKKEDPAPPTPPVPTSDWKVLQDQLRVATLEKDLLSYPSLEKATARTKHDGQEKKGVEKGGSSERPSEEGNQKLPHLDLNRTAPVRTGIPVDPTVGGRPASEITLEELAACFHLPSEVACRKLGIGLTVLKRQCRRYGIMRWPFRKIKSLDRLIHNVKMGIVPGDPDKAPVKSVEELEAQKKAMESCLVLDLDESTKKLQQAFSKAHHKAKRMAMQAGIKLDNWGVTTDDAKDHVGAGTSRSPRGATKDSSDGTDDDSQQTGERAAHFMEDSDSKDTEETSSHVRKQKRKADMIPGSKQDKSKSLAGREDPDSIHKRNRKPNPRYVAGFEEMQDPLASLAEIAEACCGTQDREKQERQTPAQPTPKSTAFCSICHMAFDLKNPRMVFLPCQHARACKSCSLDLWKKPDALRRCDKCGKQIKVKPFALGGGDITVF